MNTPLQSRLDPAEAAALENASFQLGTPMNEAYEYWHSHTGQASLFVYYGQEGHDHYVSAHADHHGWQQHYPSVELALAGLVAHRLGVTS